jgi:hypothetical protein
MFVAGRASAQAPPGLTAALLDLVPAWLARKWLFATVRYPFGRIE